MKALRKEKGQGGFSFSVFLLKSAAVPLNPYGRENLELHCLLMILYIYLQIFFFNHISEPQSNLYNYPLIKLVAISNKKI